MAASALQTAVTDAPAAVTQQLQSSASLDGSASSTAFQPMKSEPSLCESPALWDSFHAFLPFKSGRVLVYSYVFVMKSLFLFFLVPDFPKELSDMFDPTKGKLSHTVISCTSAEGSEKKYICA